MEGEEEAVGGRRGGHGRDGEMIGSSCSWGPETRIWECS